MKDFYAVKILIEDEIDDHMSIFPTKELAEHFIHMNVRMLTEAGREKVFFSCGIVELFEDMNDILDQYNELGRDK